MIPWRRRRPQRCDRCGGAGYLSRILVSRANEFNYWKDRECPTCHGTGQVHGR